jgi:general L-amino acid transport system permease protein
MAMTERTFPAKAASMARGLFSSPANAVLSASAAILLATLGYFALSFALTNAAAPGHSLADCRAVQGACWPFIAAKLDQLLAGRYPQAERWRCALAVLLPLATLALPLMVRRLRNLVGFALAAATGIAAAFLVLDGSRLGLTPVPTERWGGLTLTLMIFYVGLSTSLPVGVALALMRRSSWPVPRLLAIGFIEFWRGVPLVTVLFMASVMLPLFLPQGADLPKLTRALVALALFSGAYMAEVVRGGLQSVHDSQFEAAEALGFSYAQTLRFVILPQALRIALPGIVGTAIGMLKDTTLVLVIGLFDFLGMMQLVSADPHWAAPSVPLTGYVFVGAIFWVMCGGLSLLGRLIEKRVPLKRG